MKNLFKILPFAFVVMLSAVILSACGTNSTPPNYQSLGNLNCQFKSTTYLSSSVQVTLYIQNPTSAGIPLDNGTFTLTQSSTSNTLDCTDIQYYTAGDQLSKSGMPVTVNPSSVGITVLFTFSSGSAISSSMNFEFRYFDLVVYFFGSTGLIVSI